MTTSLGPDLAPLSVRSLGEENPGHLAGPVILSEVHYHPARGDSESSKEQSPVRTWTAGKSHTSTSPRQSSGNSRRCDDLAGRRPQPQSHQHKPWEAAVRVGQSVVESSSSPSDRMSPDSVSAASARLCEDGRSDEESCRLASSGGSRVGKESPKSEVALVNGLRGESAGKSVRELARHFEARGTK